MGALGELAAQLKLDGVPEMKSGLESVGKAIGGLKSLVNTLAGSLALLGVSFEAFKSVQGITEGLKGVFDVGLDLRTLSLVTGQSVGDLKTLQRAFKEAGLSADTLPSALEHMQAALGGVNDEGQPTAAVFARLGLSIQQLKGETAIQQLNDVGSALQKVSSQSVKLAEARQILGRSGLGLLAVLDNPEALESLGAGLSGQAAIYQRNAETFSRISLDLESIGNKTRGLFVGIADQVAPVILPLLDKLKSIDLTHLGEQIGSIVRITANAFKGGQIGELLSASLKVGGLEGVNALWEALHAASEGFGLSLLVGLRMAAQMISELVNPQNWGGLTHVLAGAGAVLESSFLRASNYLQAGMDYAVALSMDSLMEQLPGPLRFFQSFWVKALLDPVGTLATLMKDVALSFGKAVYEAMHGNLKGVWGAAEKLTHAAVTSNPETALEVMFTSALGKALTSGLGVLGPKPDFDRLLQARLDESSGTRSKLDSMAADQTKQAGESLAPLAGRTIANLKASLEDAQNSIGLGSGRLFDTGKARQKLADLAKQLDAIGAAGETGSASGAAGAISGLGAGKQIEGDRLARIGGFIGGAGGPALDFHRRTAAATEKSATLLGGILAKLGAGGGPTAPLWAN